MQVTENKSCRQCEEFAKSLCSIFNTQDVDSLQILKEHLETLIETQIMNHPGYAIGAVEALNNLIK